MNCPECGSAQTKRYAMVYAAGTSTTKSSSFGLTSKGRARSTVGRSTRQTKLAEATAPPSPPSLVLGCVGNVIVFLLLWWLSALLLPAVLRALPPQPGATVAKFRPLIVLALAGLVFAVGRIRYGAKKKRFQRAAGLWERSWICTRCGTTWAA